MAETGDDGRLDDHHHHSSDMNGHLLPHQSYHDHHDDLPPQLQQQGQQQQQYMQQQQQPPPPPPPQQQQQQQQQQHQQQQQMMGGGGGIGSPHSPPHHGGGMGMVGGGMGATSNHYNSNSIGRGGGGGSGGSVIGSSTLRPIFLGNLHPGYNTDEVIAMFEKPVQPLPLSSMGDEHNHHYPPHYEHMPVDRVDVKRGYCFVFLKDAPSQAFKESAERFVSALNGMKIDSVSDSLRAEFARGDGRVKQKEDERRKNIEPSETLFVVNFHEQTTRREDLQMLFEPYGELVRIDMKRNYAFVQFRTIAQATKAKEATNGGKLDQSVLTVEYVARQRMYDNRSERSGGDRGGRDGYRDNRGGSERRSGGGYGGGTRGRDRYDDRGGGGGRRPPSLGRGPPADRDGRGASRSHHNDRYDDRYESGSIHRSRSPAYHRHDGGRPSSRSRSPPPRYGGVGGSGGGGGYRGSRNNNMSPPRRYDDHRGSAGGGGGDYVGSNRRGSSPLPPSREYRHHSSGRRPRSPDPHRDYVSDHRDRDQYRDRDRGYRP